jgi:hypothetical protein
MQEDGSYKDSDGNHFQDKNDKTITDFKYGPQKLMGSKDDWYRKTEEDGEGWEQFNKRWEARSTEWYSPTKWLSFEKNEIFMKETRKVHKYQILFYYALINLGLGDIGPSNNVEYLFNVSSMFISALLFNILFGELGSLVFMLNEEEVER